jgi:hypothetical protein
VHHAGDRLDRESHRLACRKFTPRVQNITTHASCISPSAARLGMSLVRDGRKAPGVQIAGSCQLSPSANEGRTCIAGGFLLPHVQLRTEVHNRQTLRRICSCPAKVLAGRNERFAVLKRRRWCYVTLSRPGNTTRAFAASLLDPEDGLISILYGCHRLFAISSAPSRHCRPLQSDPRVREAPNSLEPRTGPFFTLDLQQSSRSPSW